MTSPENGIRLSIVSHDDVYLSITVLREGWGNAYRQKAAVLRLAKADMERLGLKDNARIEITGPAGSVVVTAKPDAACEAGIGLMPTSLYTNRLAGYDPTSRTLPGKHIEARAMPTEKDITPISDLKVRRNRA